MIYKNIIKGIFKKRINRFVALVEINGTLEKVHVKNTGRCKELLITGAIVYLEDFVNNMGKRKMRYSLITVKKETSNMLINMDSQAPNKVIYESLLSGCLNLPNMSSLDFIRSEYTFGNSRFDFYVEDVSGQKALIEVKGVTLESHGLAKFPDAPTIRGVKHINELILAKKNGYLSYIIFLIQMKGPTLFKPNYETHAEFGDTLLKAQKAGVFILAYDCCVTPDSLILSDEVVIDLQ